MQHAAPVSSRRGALGTVQIWLAERTVRRIGCRGINPGNVIDD
jgi:hypothetical protein